VKLLSLLAAISILASAFLSSVLITRQTIFGFDQGRDAFEARAIWHDHDVKIQGPASDIPGVHHGVLWYYLLAAPYAVNDSPIFVSFFWAAILLLTAVPWAFLTQALFKTKPITLIFICLYLLSPLSLAFTHWLNNPILGLIIAPLLLTSLWRYLHRKENSAAFLVGAFLGLLINADVAWGLYLLTLPVFLYYFKVSPTVKNAFLFFTGLLLACLTLLVSELRFGGKGIIGFAKYLTSLSPNLDTPTATIIAAVDKIALYLHNIALPVPYLLIFLGVLVLPGIIRRSRISEKDPLVFLSIWTGGVFVFYLFPSGFIGSPFMVAPVLGSVILLVSAFLYFLTPRKLLLPLLAILLVGYVSTTLSWLKADTSPLALQKGVNYQLETQILDYTYTTSQGKPFTITTVTAPLYINSLWAYLYQTYGQQKYGYLPYWLGKNQTGYLGNLPQGRRDTELFYLIQEPLEAIPELFVIKTNYEADKISDRLEEKKFGSFVVQKRRFDLDKAPIPIPTALQNMPSVLADPLL
jgi:hypothetical protein